MIKLKNITLLIIALLICSCEDKFENMNIDDNRLSSIDDKYLFTNAVKLTFKEGMNQWGSQINLCAQYSHIYVTRLIGRDQDKYKDKFPIDYYHSSMDYRYKNPLKHINEAIRLVIKNSGADNSKEKLAMLNVLSCVNYQILTDMFGDIPYSEGASGQKGILTPEYDTQESIYKDMISKLKDAVVTLKSGDASKAYPGADPLYNNDLNKWSRFANSLRLRMIMRVRNKLTNSSNLIKECLENDFIETNEQNALLKNIDSPDGDLYNLVWSIYTEKDGIWLMSEFFVEKLKVNSDPRLATFVKQNKAGNYVGLRNGIADTKMPSDTELENDFSSPTDVLYAKSKPSFIMCADEVWFLRSEASLYSLGGSNSSDANSFYQNGIRLAMQKWSVTSGDIDNYIDNASSASLSGTQTEQFIKICEQKWISFTGCNFYESYSSIRRTGFPIIPVRHGSDMALGATNGELPVRFKYPISEYSLNEDNLQKAIKNQGEDKITTKVWWDK